MVRSGGTIQFKMVDEKVGKKKEPAQADISPCCLASSRNIENRKCMDEKVGKEEPAGNIESSSEVNNLKFWKILKVRDLSLIHI